MIPPTARLLGHSSQRIHAPRFTAIFCRVCQPVNERLIQNIIPPLAPFTKTNDTPFLFRFPNPTFFCYMTQPTEHYPHANNQTTNPWADGPAMDGTENLLLLTQTTL